MESTSSHHQYIRKQMHTYIYIIIYIIYHMYIYIHNIQEYLCSKVSVPQLSCQIWFHSTMPWNIRASLKIIQTWALVIHNSSENPCICPTCSMTLPYIAKAWGRYRWKTSSWDGHATQGKHGPLFMACRTVQSGLCGQTATCLWIAYHVSLMSIF